jgi:CubicO group peptidase (beta-lactamase class C family)
MIRCHLARRIPECFCPHSQYNSNACGDDESSPLKAPVAFEIQLLMDELASRRQLKKRVLVYSSMLVPTSTEFQARSDPPGNGLLDRHSEAVFMHGVRFLLMFAMGLLGMTSTLWAEPATLPRSTPESQGVSSLQVRKFIEAADKRVTTMHSFMLVRNGHVVAECWWKPEAPDKPHVLWSLSKSFTSTAVGLAVAEGKFSIDDPVLKFFPEDAPASPSEKLRMMRVRDLLTMSTGHETEPDVRGRTDQSWVKTFLEHPVPHKPGAHFQYNTPATYMLSAIVEKTTGQTVLEYLKPRLFEPLGIENPRWDTSPQGITLGGYGLFVRTEDIAKFGQLYLQKGQWNGNQLLSPEWVALATSKQVSNGSDPTKDWDQGYGFQFWRSRHGAFRGDGKDGQFCVVIPERNVVIAITANTRDMQGQLNVVWDELLSAFADAPLPENTEEQAKLKELSSQLQARDPK